MKNEIILQAMSRQELKDMIQELMHSEFQTMNKEIQRVVGDDDLVSTGTACRILGVCSKVDGNQLVRMTTFFLNRPKLAKLN